MEWLVVISLIVGIGAALSYWYWYPTPTTGNSTNQDQENFIETYVFPSFLESKIKAKYPHLTEHQVAKVTTGLRDFFLACQRAGRILVGMPSQVVDVAWHEFILDTREYHYFCERAFNRFLHHTPAEAMPVEEDAQTGLKRAWVLSCSNEGIDPKAPTRLSLLFALDAELKIFDGFYYSLDHHEENGAPFCAKEIGCTWVPTRQDPPKRLEPVSASSRRNCGGCTGGSSCGGGCGGD